MDVWTRWRNISTFAFAAANRSKNKYGLMKTVAEADDSGKGICDSYAAEHR